MDKVKKYKIVFDCAKNFLAEIIAQHPGLSKPILEKHLEHESKFDTMEDATKRLIISLQNRNMMASVINFKGREALFASILCGYNARTILKKYPGPGRLFEVFKKKFDIRNARSKGNLWWKFSEGIVSGSQFLASFKNKDEFDRFIKNFALNKFTKAALPMLLGQEIKGFGFALACDFLKELGYRDYPKPDVHLIEIFSELGLCQTRDPYEVYKAMIEMSETVGEDAYTVDKIFWLISSGRFYLTDIHAGRKRDEFIKYTLTAPGYSLT